MPSITLVKRRIQGQSFEGQTYEKLDLSSMLGFGTKWKDCTFISTDLLLADLRNTRLESCHFFGCDLTGASFAGGSELRHVTFEQCQMRHAIFAGCSPLDDVKFLDCKLSYSTFFDATIREVRFIDSNLHGADLRFIENGKAIFDRTVLWGASINLNCQNLGTQNSFDERSANLFVAMVARLHPNEDKAVVLKSLAEDQLGVVERLMQEPEP